MNKNINLCELLKDCPINTEFYSPMLGNCKLSNVNSHDVVVGNSKGVLHISPNGTAIIWGYNTVEVMLFPSETQRDWSKWECPKPKKPKFDPKTLKVFDKVLVRDAENHWEIDTFGYIDEDGWAICLNNGYSQCIPINNDTKNLFDTREEAPEYYKYWKD